MPFKLLKTKNKVVYISRQSDTPSLDFLLLKEKLEKMENSVKQVILAKKIGKGIIGKVSYGFHIICQMYHIATSKVVVVDTYVIPVSVLRHKKSLKIIQIWHALGAIKQFGYQVIGKKEGSSDTVANAMRMHKNYTAITCASSETAKFYSEAFNTEIEKIKVIGMPRVDEILGKNKNKEILKQNPNYKNKKTILYIPTFRKNGTVNIQDIINNVDTEKYNLIIKLHPLDKAKVPDKYLIKGDFTTYDILKFSDYIITDYSATAIEASLLQKPIFLYVYDIEEYSENRGLNIDLTQELKASTYVDIKDILKIIESGKYNYNELREFRDKYVETHDQNNTKNICKLIKEYLR